MVSSTIFVTDTDPAYIEIIADILADVDYLDVIPHFSPLSCVLF
jgi:hypothetical protein